MMQARQRARELRRERVVGHGLLVVYGYVERQASCSFIASFFAVLREALRHRRDKLCQTGKSEVDPLGIYAAAKHILACRCKCAMLVRV